jgi:uncharacterized protein
MGLDKGLLDKLVCPKCRGQLEIYGEDEGLDCQACKLRFSVEKYGDDVWVPNMIIEQATDIG